MMDTVKKEDMIPIRRMKTTQLWTGVIVLCLIVAGTGFYAEFDLPRFLQAIPGILSFIAIDFLPPTAAAVPDFIGALMDTFFMAVVSTVLGSIIALFLSLLSSAKTAPNKLLEVLIRAFASALRNIPALAWTLVLVPAFGIGKTVGLIAMTISSIGSLSRFFMESLEEIDTAKQDAIRSVGGSYWQVIRYGVLPQSMPGLYSWALYNFELDIRASTIIGMVGGGGIGFYIQSKIKLFQYDDAMMAILLVAVIVLLIEQITKRLREVIL